MQTIKKLIAEQILASVKGINPEAELTAVDVAGMLEYPPDANMGDLAFPCFRLSKTLRRAPVQIAAALCEALQSGEVIGKAEAVNGYLNITVSNDYLAKNVIPEILEKANTWFWIIPRPTWQSLSISDTWVLPSSVTPCAACMSLQDIAVTGSTTSVTGAPSSES